MHAPPIAADPVADPRSLVIAGNVRITVLTPHLLRLEWSATGAFEDRASLLVRNRRLAPSPFRVAERRGALELHTGALRVRYSGAGRAFDAENLWIDLHAGPRRVRWTPGAPATGNLGGTCRTLDMVSGAAGLEPGILSRDGWALVDDSSRLLLDGGDPPWPVQRREGERQDWYFFGHGLDYKQALLDFTRLAGRIPLPPRYVFGGWWSRYWAYTDAELRALVAEFRAHDVPLDVLVIDMDWHLEGWTGYTWNPACFPDPEGFLRWAHDQGLRVALNLHPADGVGRHEAGFAAMCHDLGLDPGRTHRIPFNCSDRRFVEAYFKRLHHPLERQGVDFWWMDWQQGHDSGVPGLDPLYWLNELHWNDWQRDPGAKRERPLIFSRWGGLGNHRYPIGFSGDTFSDWQSLAFQPHFTATAGNVGYGFWSHDIGGHMNGPVEPELYVRWIQWGALSPILRTHTTKHPHAERRLWAFDARCYEIARAAWRLRYELLPYIYSAARQTHDRALPLCRPLYYEWPEHEAAYRHPHQYQFGDHMLVASVAEPVSRATGCASVKLWIPPGSWTHWVTGRSYQGPSEARLLAPLDQIPLLVRNGAAIPAAPPMRSSGERPLDPLILHVFRPDASSPVMSELYEDDGDSRGYERGVCRWTSIVVDAGASSVQIRIDPVRWAAGAPPEGAAAAAHFPAARSYELHVHDAPSAALVRLSGQPLKRIDGAAPGAGWWLDESSGTLNIRTDRRAVDVETVVGVEFAERRDANPCRTQGTRELRAIARLLEENGVGPQDDLMSQAAGDLGGLVRRINQSRAGLEVQRQALARLLGAVVHVSMSNAAPADSGWMADLEASLQPIVAGWDALIAWRLEIDANERLNLAPRPAMPAAAAPAVAARHLHLHVTPRDVPQTVTLHGRLEIEVGGEEVSVPFEHVFLPSINAWWLLGPFERSDAVVLDSVLAAQDGVDPEETFQGVAGEAVRWRHVARPVVGGPGPYEEFRVDLAACLGGSLEDACAYACVWLEAPRDQTVQLALGSSDGATVWLRGRPLHVSATPRPFASRTDRIELPLKKGANRLLLRIDHLGGSWCFAAHVQTPDGRPLPVIAVRLAR